MTTHRTSLWVPAATVFTSSACIMVIELVAGRLVSRFIGQSLYSWTTIIGVVLAGIALGNYAGGRLADVSPTRRTLAVQLILAALGCALVLPLNGMVGSLGLLHGLAWPLRIFVHITLVFLIPSILLGTISPVIAKRALLQGNGTGRTMGSVYAFAIAGSIAGTFVTGYLLIAWMTTTAIIASTAATLAMLGLAYGAASLVLPRETAAASVPKRGRTESSKPVSLKDLLYPVFIVFMANACLMAAEIGGGRIVSRHYGQSIYAWTTIIGVILGGMTVGSYLGGRWADRFAAGKTLSVLFAASAVSCFCVPLITKAIVTSQIVVTYSWPMQIAFHVLLTFALPSLLLGATAPVTARMALECSPSAGRAVGSIYAWGSVGSIAGTFLAGFYLVAAMGVDKTLYAVAAILVLMALFTASRARPMRIAAGILLPVPVVIFALSSNPALPVEEPNAVYKTESQYSYIMVVKDPEQDHVRQMLLDRLMHSRVNMNDPLDIQYDYEQTYTGVLDKYYPPGRPMKALLIGGGGYIYPRYIEVTRPGSYVEVAEIDPAVTEAAYAAFGLPRDTTIRSFSMDARNRVADLIRKKEAGENVPLFDCIFGDSFNDCSVPYHLTTVEFNRDLRRLLAPDGIYMLNMIDIFDSGQFLASVVNTCRAVWPNVYVFSSGGTPSTRDTFVVVSSARPLALEGLPQMLGQKYDYVGRLIPSGDIQRLLARTGHPTLTDNYAPVENMLRPVVRFSEDAAVDSLLNSAENLIAEGKQDEAGERIRRALKLSSRSARAYELLGHIESVKGDTDSAIQHLSRSLEINPESKQAMSRLARALFFKGDLNSSLDVLKRLEKLDPNYPTLHQQMAAVYTATRQYDDAWNHIHKARELGETVHPGVLDKLVQDSGRTQ